MTGLVLRSTGSWYQILQDDGKRIDARLRGKLRMAESKSTNPVAVGDRVVIDIDEEEGVAVIDEILDRKNYISRESPKHQYSRHVIAANLDQAIMIATISQPRTSTGFIDRFLVTAEAFEIPAHVIFNKVDVYRKKDLAKLEEYTAIYEDAGYGVHIVSATERQNIEAVRDLLQNKTSLIAGHSGVGKTTLINAIDSNLHLRTAEISVKHNKGKHTTTYAEMFPMAGGGFIIDTPGIKEFGILDLEPQEVCHYFPEMHPFLGDCRFNNCLHLEEPQCGVRAAYDGGEISFERYNNYMNIVFSCKARPKY